jgi:hypothetical protein
MGRDVVQQLCNWRVVAAHNDGKHVDKLNRSPRTANLTGFCNHSEVARPLARNDQCAGSDRALGRIDREVTDQAPGIYISNFTPSSVISKRPATISTALSSGRSSFSYRFAEQPDSSNRSGFSRFRPRNGQACVSPPSPSSFSSRPASC